MIKQYHYLPTASWRERTYHSYTHGVIHHFIMGCICVYIVLMSLKDGYDEFWVSIITDTFWAIVLFEFVSKLILNHKNFLSKISAYIELGTLIVAIFVPGVLIIYVFRFSLYLYTFFDHPVINRVVHTFLHSLPTLMMSSSALGGCMFGYGLLANVLFGKEFPELFGSISKSIISFIQIMTFDDWVVQIFKPVTQLYPFAALIFLSFIILIVFGVLNIFVGTVVHSMSAVGDQYDEENPTIKALRKEVLDIKKLLMLKDQSNS